MLALPNTQLPCCTRKKVYMSLLTKLFEFPSKIALALLMVFAAGCGSGSLDPVLGSPGALVTPIVIVPVVDNVSPTVTFVTPINVTINVCLTKTISATFSEPMNPATINTMTFVVTDNGVTVSGTVTYDVTTNVASFTPVAAAGFATSRTFTVTIKAGSAGVKDVAGNALAIDQVWSFTSGAQTCLSPIALGTSALFGAFGGAA